MDNLAIYMIEREQLHKNILHAIDPIVLKYMKSSGIFNLFLLRRRVNKHIALTMKLYGKRFDKIK